MESTSSAKSGQRQPNDEAATTGQNTIRGRIGITDPSTRQPFTSVHQTGGVDFLEISLWVGWSSGRWDELADELERLRKQSEEARDSNSGGLAVFETDDGDQWGVMPGGFGRGIRCKYGLQHGGITIGLTGRREFSDCRPNVRVSVPSAPLMYLGHREAWELIQGTLAALGGEIVRSNTSRLDICADVIGVESVSLVTAMVNGHYKGSPANVTPHMHNRIWTGVTAGSQPQMVIYDKKLEVLKTPDKIEVFIDRRCGGRWPDSATRCEFRMNAEHLKERYTFADVESVFARLPDIQDYFAHKWMIVTDGPVDRKNRHQDRATPHPDWIKVQQAFENWTGQATGSWLKPIRRSKISTKKLNQMGFGAIASGQAVIDPDAMDEQAIRQYWRDQENDYVRHAKACMEAKRKKAQFTSSLGVPVHESSIPF